jgi:hypothetical protein
MTQSAQPPSRESQDTSERREADAPVAPETAADQRRGVLQQRQHIKDLDGEDPLRGGVAD